MKRSGTRKMVESKHACRSAGQKLDEPDLSRFMLVAAMCCFSLESSKSSGDGSPSHRSWQVLRIIIGRKASATDSETPRMRSPNLTCSAKGNMVRNKLEVARTAENDAKIDSDSLCSAALTANDNGMLPIRVNV